MSAEEHRELKVCNDRTQPLPRLSDQSGVFLHCAGGFRAAMTDKNQWMIMPVLDGGKPCAKGYFSKPELQIFVRQIGLGAIAYEHTGWTDGDYRSAWFPFFPGHTDPTQGPSELWMNAASNLAGGRLKQALETMEKPTSNKIGIVLDNASDVERLARSISLCLRSMDTSVKQIVEFYHEQLTNFLAAGRISGDKSGSSMDDALYAHVHAFFLQFGAARDYLANLIALRLGMKWDAMSWLVVNLRPTHAVDPLVNILVANGYLRLETGKKGSTAGWLKEATELRNQFVHRRPYGSRFAEGFGHVRPISAALGLHRYARPIIYEDGFERDLLDVVLYNYAKTLTLFMQIAKAAGLDASALVFTKKDIVSLTLPRGRQETTTT